MIYLSYKLSDELNTKAPLIDWVNADEMTLRYYVYLGDQLFLADEADFSARWGWIPILDFAACLVLIARALTSGETNRRFEFTESEDYIDFTRQENRVVMSSNYTTARAEVALDELQSAARSYANTVFEGATALHPALKNNLSFLSWYPSKI